jgi:preprotein translocase subunit SecA
MNAVAKEYRQCQITRPPEPLAGLDNWMDGWLGRYRRRSARVRDLRREAEAVDGRDEDVKFLSDAALQRHLLDLREKFRRRNRATETCLHEALACIREAAHRTMAMRPFTVQIMGALALHRGCLAEMATGEGKTLTAAVAAVLAGWTGRPCHIVTVNDYLARRDADWLRPLYEFCGVSVGCVTSIMAPEDRARGYAQDVTYTTSKEVVADFLRDRLRLGEHQHPTRRLLRRHLTPHNAGDGLVMRGLHTAIIDEADSVLIDEAVTPLIISARRDNSAMQEMYAAVWQIVNQLHVGQDYDIDVRYKEIVLRPEGRRHIEAACAVLPERWRGAARPLELVEQALTAREFFRKGKQYVVHEGQVVIVDEFTGRMMPMRKWRHGLHQAIEAKEGLPISSVDETLARVSFQRFFRLYPRLAGMTGTATETAGELWQTYRLLVLRIPTNRPVNRTESADRIFPTLAAKLDAVVADVVERHRVGRPVLVGTRNVAMSEMVAERLRAQGCELCVLNALNDREEAQIVAQAGQRGAITIATNMAGRGTDIVLGAGVAELGGLHVIATERHESRRIDRQLFGRAARQGDAGSAIAYVSAEDELVSRFTPGPILRLLNALLERNNFGGLLLGRWVCRLVQRGAQAQARSSRKAVMKMDVWLDEAVSFSGPSNV